MRIAHIKWLGACILLAGCVTSPQSQVRHEVRIVAHSNDFLQTHELATQSVRYVADEQGNRWPTGWTLSAQAVRHAKGERLYSLVVRKGKASPEKVPSIYKHRNALQQRLQRQCTTLKLVQGSRSLSFPISSLTVQALTRRDLMPVPPTDTTADPLKTLVGNNVSDGFVLTVTAQAQLDPSAWADLASAQALIYELCGEAATASKAELDGLRQVIAQSAHLGEGDTNRPQH